MDIVAEEKCFGGVQRVYRHRSAECRCDMRFAVFVPPGGNRRWPVVTWLSGLTCTEQNFITKAGAQRAAAELGLMIVAPDTSPRGDDVPDRPDAYDFGQGAGFYVDATAAPWSEHYRMYSYVTDELQQIIRDALPADPARQGIFGHSMGGHGALVAHLRNPALYRSVSAFAPIVAPSRMPWGRKAFGGYLGDDETAWAQYDATRLVERRPSDAHILIDQGDADAFLDAELQPQRFREACEQAGQSLTLRMQPGYTHSYYFIATFIDEHLRHHAAMLSGA